MAYRDIIKELINKIGKDLIDLKIPRERARRPTDVSSEFVTNKEQGDWAEQLVTRAINEHSTHYVAIKYGKSDGIIAGEEGFASFYEQYQNELDTIGKRPDVLLFRREDFDEGLGYDISGLEHGKIESYVKKAVAGIEVRSSSFLIDKYNEAKHSQYVAAVRTIFECKRRLLEDYRDLLEGNDRRASYFEIAENINEDNLHVINFSLPV